MSVQEIKAKLQQEILEATWHALAPHAARDALLLVSRRLELADAGLAMALDDARAVGAWVEQGLLQKPSAEACEAWRDEPRKMFRMVIVAPFVLAHELSPEEADAYFQTHSDDPPN